MTAAREMRKEEKRLDNMSSDLELEAERLEEEAMVTEKEADR